MNTSHATILGLLLVTVLTLGLTLPGEKGLVSVYKMHSEINNMKLKNAEFKTDNSQLARKALLLRENNTYIEHVIIKEMNMVRPGDIVVVLKSQKN